MDAPSVHHLIHTVSKCNRAPAPLKTTLISHSATSTFNLFILTMKLDQYHLHFKYLDRGWKHLEKNNTVDIVISSLGSTLLPTETALISSTAGLPRHRRIRSCRFLSGWLLYRSSFHHLSLNITNNYLAMLLHFHLLKGKVGLMYLAVGCSLRGLH